MKEYKGGDILEHVLITIKLDGVQAIWTDEGKAVSRNGKPLHNLPNNEEGHKAEIFLGSFKESISAVKTHHGLMVTEDAIYQLSPYIDERLLVQTRPKGITQPELMFLLTGAIKDGHEGLVLHFVSGREPLKLKKKLDVSVLITGIVEGTGRNKGRLGALITTRGRVGTGFTDQDRVDLFTDHVIGLLVDVEAMEITADGKLRHSRFVKLRPDIS